MKPWWSPCPNLSDSLPPGNPGIVSRPRLLRCSSACAGSCRSTGRRDSAGGSAALGVTAQARRNFACSRTTGRRFAGLSLSRAPLPAGARPILFSGHWRIGDSRLAAGQYGIDGGRILSHLQQSVCRPDDPEAPQAGGGMTAPGPSRCSGCASIATCCRCASSGYGAPVPADDRAAAAAADTGNRAADVASLMASVNATLERWIRERPEQWFWVHRRWPDPISSRPDDS